MKNTTISVLPNGMVLGNQLRSVRPTTMNACREGGKGSSKSRIFPTLHVYTLERNQKLEENKERHKYY